MRCISRYDMKLILMVSYVLLLVITAAHGRSAEEWKSRVIYQLLTDRFASGSSTSCSNLRNYCGGTFQGIIRQLDYIQGLGVNAIWISPIPQQTDTPHQGYHGFWQENIYEINSHFGTENDLKELVDACHSRGIWVMLDVVANHMGNQIFGDWNNFTFFVPFNQSEHYHPYCLITDFGDQHQAEVCRLANLPDLNQSNSFVRSTLKSWVNDTISKYGFDGIRVDTTPEVPMDFWAEYSRSAGVFSIGEVFNGNPQYVSGYQGVLDATLNYPMYFKLLDAFQRQQTMINIRNGVTQNSVFPDVSILGNFVDNHDNPRFLHNNGDQTLLKNALAYIVFAEGIPIIYYGTEQGFSGGRDPEDRESLWPNYNTSSDLYVFISTVVNFRVQQGSSLYDAEQIERYVDDQFFAFTRGEVFVATTNIGSGQSLSRTITFHPYSNGTELVNLLDSSDTVTVINEQFEVNIENGQPKMYSPVSEDDDSAGVVVAAVLSSLVGAVIVAMVIGGIIV